MVADTARSGVPAQGTPPQRPRPIILKESFSSTHSHVSDTNMRAFAEDGTPIAMVLVEPELGFHASPVPHADLDVYERPDSQLLHLDQPTLHEYARDYSYPTPSPCTYSPCASPVPPRWATRPSIDFSSNPLEVYGNRNTALHRSTPVLSGQSDYQMNENDARRCETSDDHGTTTNSTEGGCASTNDGHEGSVFTYEKPRPPFSMEGGGDRSSGNSGSDSSVRSSMPHTPIYASSCDSFKPSPMVVRLPQSESGGSAEPSPRVPFTPMEPSAHAYARKSVLATTPQTRRKGHSSPVPWMSTWGSSDTSVEVPAIDEAESPAASDASGKLFSAAVNLSTQSNSLQGHDNTPGNPSPLRSINASRTTLDTATVASITSYRTESTIVPSRRPSKKLKKKRKAPLIFDVVSPSHLIRS